MPYRIASRMNHLKASEIREILKVTQHADMISFAGGLPAPELFPVEESARACARLLEQEGRKVLQYSTTEGDPRLRAALADRMNTRLGTRVHADEILLTGGSQQGLDLTGKVFLDEGDVVLCESPTYLGAIQALRTFGPRFVEVPTDDDGMLPEELEKRLAGPETPKLIYVIPDFQNPSGRSWSEERRRRLLEIAGKYPVTVIEDCPYIDIRFEGEPAPTLKSMDTRDQVVFLGSFSKIFCPGLRLGWLAAPAELLAKYVLVKQGTDLHTSTLTQALVVHYLDMYDLDANVSRICATYRARRDVMLEALRKELPEGTSFTHPQGGLFVWLELPEDISARDLLPLCLERGVAFVPGGSFFPNGGHENTLRLNFSNMPEERIREGIRRLAEALRTLMETSRKDTLPPTTCCP